MLALVAVVVVVIVGFLKIGSPAQNRLIALDSQRLSDLYQLANAAYQTAYKSTTTSPFPTSIEELASSSPYYGLALADEEGRPYVYHLTSSSTFELCATFETEQKATIPQRAMRGPVDPNFWDHPKGDHCFTFVRGKYPPYFYRDYYPSSPSPSLFGL